MAERFGLTSRGIIAMILQGIALGLPDDWIQKISWYNGDSNQETETYKFFGASPAMRQWIGGRQAKGLGASPITIKNLLFEATMEVLVDDLRRDRAGVIRQQINQMILQPNSIHWRSLLTTAITGGTAVKCYDGDYFFGSAHVSGASGTQVNLLTNSQVGALDLTVGAPTQAEMSAAIMGVIAYMLNWKNDQGEPLNEDAREFVMMVPYFLWGPAMAACTQNLLTGASGATSGNVLINSGFTVRPVMNPRLTTTTVFYMFRTDAVGKPFIMQEEGKPTVSAVAEGSEMEHTYNKHEYGVKASRNVGLGEWAYAAHCTIS